MPMSIAPSAHSTGISSVRKKGDVDRHFAAAGEQAALLAAKAQAGLFQQLAGDFGQSAFAGNADPQIIHEVSRRRRALGARGLFVQARDAEPPGQLGFDFGQAKCRGSPAARTSDK